MHGEQISIPALSKTNFAVKGVFTVAVKGVFTVTFIFVLQQGEFDRHDCSWIGAVLLPRGTYYRPKVCSWL